MCIYVYIYMYVCTHVDIMYTRMSWAARGGFDSPPLPAPYCASIAVTHMYSHKPFLEPTIFMIITLKLEHS